MNTVIFMLLVIYQTLIDYFGYKYIGGNDHVYRDSEFHNNAFLSNVLQHLTKVDLMVMNRADFFYNFSHSF